jgi:hypothetical protein
MIRTKAVMLLSAVLLSAGWLCAQSQTEKKPPSPKDQALAKMRELRGETPAYVESITSFVLNFPDALEVDSAGYMLGYAVPKTGADPSKVRELVQLFVTGLEPAPAEVRVRLYTTPLSLLLEHNLGAETVELARKGIGLIDEQKYMELERKRFETMEAMRKERMPDSKPREFNPADTMERYRTFHSGYYVSLGRGYLSLQKLDEADGAFQRAFGIKAAMESSWGRAEVAERRGNSAEALEFATYAALTGRLKAKELSHFQELYRKVHPESPDGVEAYLDARYRKTYSNPVSEQKYRAPAGRGDRAVLAEFITGGGCVPCVPFDYSFEAALEEYSRKELVLLVYHWHAPSVDPLGNRSNDARVTYYGVNSAPTVILDGRKFDARGNDDARSRTDADALAQKVHDMLSSAINARLLTASQAHLELKAKRSGRTVKATAVAKRIPAASANVSLHIALVERETTYSGENGLRFQPMVVRKMAAPSAGPDPGYAVVPGKSNRVEYTFDIDAIMAEYLRYYEEWPVERKKELAARIDKATLDRFDFSFREKRHVIDPKRLCVAAFLQDNKTKEILQAAFVELPAR